MTRPPNNLLPSSTTDIGAKSWLCKCVKLCGGPNGPGKELKSYSTYRRHLNQNASIVTANSTLAQAPQQPSSLATSRTPSTGPIRHNKNSHPSAAAVPTNSHHSVSTTPLNAQRQASMSFVAYQDGIEPDGMDFDIAAGAQNPDQDGSEMCIELLTGFVLSSQPIQLQSFMMQFTQKAVIRVGKM
ncbi:hypothetical protein L218DRAFT_1006707 [Marasmius fiardii PR-910]|nr:hypothetical protein L218DRAFT_1006707 [Marasmius fiardii PR-910]